MENRGDMTCFHEPYNEAYYYGEDRRNDRYYIADPTLKVTQGLSLATVHSKLTDLVQQEPVFIKDFAYSVAHICLLYTSPSPRDGATSRMPSSA